MIEVLYRIASINTSEQWECKLKIEEYRVLRYTPKGYWITIYPKRMALCDGLDYTDGEYTGRTKWVSSDAKKRFAYPTVTGAYDNFIARKKRQMKILRVNLHRAETYLKQAEKEIKQMQLGILEVIK